MSEAVKCRRCGYVRIVPPDDGCPSCATAEQEVAHEPRAPASAAPGNKAMRESTEIGITTFAVLFTAALVAGSIALVTGTGNYPSRPRTDQDVYNDNSYAIRDHCRHAIENRLNDPDSVKWDDERASAAPGRFEIVYRFRAKNAFGAYRRAAFRCNVDKQSIQVMGVADVSSTFAFAD